MTKSPVLKLPETLLKELVAFSTNITILVWCAGSSTRIPFKSMPYYRFYLSVGRLGEQNSKNKSECSWVSINIKANCFQVRVMASVAQKKEKKPLCKHQSSVRYLMLSDFFRGSSNAIVRSS